MKYKWVTWRFVMEIVKEVTKVVNSLPKEDGVHIIQSHCQIVRGIMFRIPHTLMRQYIKGHLGGSKNIEEERMVD